MAKKLDLTKILEEIKKAKNEVEVREIKVGGDEIFNKEERKLFTETSLIKSKDDAVKVAMLLARIKVAMEEKKKDDKLLDDLETERDANFFQGSMVYRVLNADWTVRRAINYLTLLRSVGGTKDEREARIKQLEKEIGEKRIELSLEDTALIPMEGRLISAFQNEEAEKSMLQRRESIKSLISQDASLADFQIKYQGADKNISTITINNVKDYSGKALWDGTATATATNVRAVLQRADGFLNSITQDTDGINSGNSYKYAKGKGNYFNGRVYHSKQTLVAVKTNIGRGVLEALRSFGTEKLKKIVSLSGVTGSKKTKLEKIAEELGDGYIHWQEPITGQKGYIQANDTWGGWGKKYDEWQRKLLTRSQNEYPYVDAPNWENVFEFITNVFPIDASKTTADKTVVEGKSYLVDKNSDGYLAPDDEKKGWENKIWLKGYSTKGTDGKSMVWLAKNVTSGASKIWDDLRIDNKIPSDWDFKTIIELWYDCFDPFVDFGSGKWKTAFDYTNNKTTQEEVLHNMRCELRYCLTMRELFLELGFSKNINDLDEYILEIADRAEKEALIGGNRANLAKSPNTEQALTLDEKFLGSSLVLKAISEGKLWGEDYTKSKGQVLEDLIETSKNRVLAASSEVDVLKKQRGEIEEKKMKIIFSINAKKAEIAHLKEVSEFDDAPIDDKKKIFNDTYNKKSSQQNKWLLRDITKMLNDFLPKIKEQLGDDAFKSEEFESKELELKNILELIKEPSSNINIYWEEFQNDPNGGTPSKTIKLILESKDTEEAGKAELQKIVGFFNQLEEKIILTDQQKDCVVKLNEAIGNPNKFKDSPTSDLTPEKLKAIVGFDVDQTLTDKWKASIEGKTLSEAKIKEILGAYDKSTKETQWKALLGHLRERGIEGKDNSKATETDDAKLWEKFLKENEPVAVIKTIVVHENDDILKGDPDKDKKKAKIKEMREDSEAGYNKDDKKKNTFKKDRYGDPTEGQEDKVTREQLLNWLLDKKINNIQKGEAWEKNETPTPTPTPTPSGNGDKGEMGWKKEWFGFGSIGKSILSYSLIFLAVTGVGVAIFWKQIKEWWSGPAEEEGQIGEKTEEETESE